LAKEVPIGGTFLCPGWPPTMLVRVEAANFCLPVSTEMATWIMQRKSAIGSTAWLAKLLSLPG
jgi:hypothetical protein